MLQHVFMTGAILPLLSYAGTHTGTMNREMRLKQIEQILINHPNGIRAVEISQLVGVNRRTIYRDLVHMEEMGLPLWQDGGRFGIQRQEYVTALPLNFNEVIVVLWALRLLSQYADAANPHVASIMRKLATALPNLSPEEFRQPLDKHHRRRFHVIETVSQAWVDSLMVHVEYRREHGSKTTHHKIAPYIIDTTAKGKLYTVAWDEELRKLRLFLLSNITRAQITKEPFTVPSNIDVVQHYVQNNTLEALEGWEVSA